MKRGESGISLLAAVDKPGGMSSHDVVNVVRRTLGERRVGHAGTLDPFATGVLPIMVGPATRLDRYLSSDWKSYIACIEFGSATTTDDRCGEVVRSAAVPEKFLDSSFAEESLSGFLGDSMQMPPAYSAIKVGGRKACDEARKGNLIELKPRRIHVRRAELLGIFEHDGAVVWKVDFHVYKGTYIRALARDIGSREGVPSHLRELERSRFGDIRISDCYTIEAFEELGAAAAMDPVRVLGLKIVFAEGALEPKVANGGALDASGIRFFEYSRPDVCDGCGCIPALQESANGPQDGELVSVVSDNVLSAIYRYGGKAGILRPDCVFQVGVSRGEVV